MSISCKTTSIKRLLIKGSESWNDFVSNVSPAMTPDLSNIDLRGMNLELFDLSGLDLSFSNLAGCSLLGANLKRSKLVGTNFTGANLERSNLEECYAKNSVFISSRCSFANFNDSYFSSAYLINSDFSFSRFRNSDMRACTLDGSVFHRADLSNALLDEASLDRTIITSSNINNTSLYRTILKNTSLNNVNLRNIRHIGDVVHHGESSIGVDTIINSQGLIDRTFLAKAGCPDHFINNIKQLLPRSDSKYYSCFISYSSDDYKFTNQLHSHLQMDGIKCWIDKEDMTIGSILRSEVDIAIQGHQKFLIVLSENSISSSWVEKEVLTAFDIEHKSKKEGNFSPIIYPIAIDKSVYDSRESWVQDIIRSRHVLNFSNWKDFQEFRRSYKKLLEGMQKNRINDVAKSQLPAGSI